MDVQERAEEFRQVFTGVQAEIEKVVVGQSDLIEELLICFFSGGHALLEGVPGTGKTLIVKTLGQCFGLEFSRIQFTPDLMPSDVIGTNFVVETLEGKQFRFEKGPLFCQILLADEINRATPKTQSALLEAMQECSVTIGGTHYELRRPFIVLATQNPLEMEGTYPLPEAQLDRFLFKLLVPLPSRKELNQIIERVTDPVGRKVKQLMDADKVEEIKPLLWNVPIAEEVRDYIVRVVMATHPGQFSPADSVQKFVRYGASPRGAIAMALGAKARALLCGRYNVSFEDVRTVASLALRHRLILNFEGEAACVSPDSVVKDVIEHMPTQDLARSPVLARHLQHS